MRRNYLPAPEGNKMAIRIIPLIGTVETDWPDDCTDESVYHVAVAPDERLDIQRRIANAVYCLPRPVSQNAFWGAAVMAEDAYIGIATPWPEGHTERFISVVRRMWSVVSHTQLRVS